MSFKSADERRESKQILGNLLQYFKLTTNSQKLFRNVNNKHL